jgi:flagellar motor switch protein FliN/FliY
MADEEKLESADKLEDQNDQAPDAEEAEIPQETMDEVAESGEKSVDDLAEQQMLEELERLESQDGGEGSVPEKTILSAEKGEVNEQDVHIPEYPSFGKTTSTSEQKNLDLLLDVNLPISIELGRTTMRIKDILSLGPGSVVELKKLAGEPVDLLVNNKIVAKGEVVVVDENFGLRITSLLSPEERLRSLND